MSRIKTLQELFKRYRRPGDIVFATLFFAFSLALLSQLFSQTQFRSGSHIFAQPRFWPGVSLALMSIFAGLHLLGSFLSERIEGRWPEVMRWVASLEFAGWFVAYAALVPYLGYLPTTVLFAVALCLRMGYRSALVLGGAVAASVAIVVLFKALLQVNLPAGQIYHALPDGLRQIMLTYF